MKGDKCARSCTNGWECTGHRKSLQSLNNRATPTKTQKHATPTHTRTNPSPPKLPPTVKGEEQISAMQRLRAALTDGAGTYDGAEPSCA